MATKSITELKTEINQSIKSPASPKISGTILNSVLTDMTDSLIANSRINDGLYTCSTAAATATKAVTIADYVLAAGGSFKIKFTYANSASSPVLKINTENSHAIVFNGAVASATNTWGAGEVVEFYYDPTYNSNAGGFIGKSTVVSVSQNMETDKVAIQIGGATPIEVASGNLVDKTPVIQDNGTDIDLEVTDGLESVLLQCKGGHIKTKNFDSSNIEHPVNTDFLGYADLEIVDGNNMPILRCADGEIITKNFNSRVPRFSKASYIYYIAASDSSNNDKLMADYVCDGINDTAIIQSVVNLCTTSSKILFFSGTYYLNPTIEDDGGEFGAIVIPNISRVLTFEGAIDCGPVYAKTIFKLKQSDYTALSDDVEYALIRGEKVSNPIGNDVVVRNIELNIYDNQKKITCVDGSYMGALSLFRCKAIVDCLEPPLWSDNPRDTFHAGNLACCAFKGMGGIQHAYSLWERCSCHCFGVGFAVQGEHLTLDNCGAVACYYGHAFNFYPPKVTYLDGGGWTHGMVVLNDLEELCLNAPYFGINITNMPVNIQDFHVEWKPGYFALSGDKAKERTPGTWRGNISYQITNSNYINSVDVSFWEDGNGHGMITRNQAQLQACSSSVRATYAPNYMQHLFDTTLNKELICIDEGNKTWVDVNGNNV